MTKEDEILEQSKDTIRKETKLIADSVTRILMLGGPKMVEAILRSLLSTNEKIINDLKVDLKVEFEEGK